MMGYVTTIPLSDDEAREINRLLGITDAAQDQKYETEVQALGNTGMALVQARSDAETICFSLSSRVISRDVSDHVKGTMNSVVVRYHKGRETIPINPDFSITPAIQSEWRALHISGGVTGPVHTKEIALPDVEITRLETTAAQITAILGQMGIRLG